jgi:hypothetical protein
VVLDGYLKETNSKLYCEMSYFKTLLKNDLADLSRIEMYIASLTDRRNEFAIDHTSTSMRKRDHSQSREKSLKVTLKPHHDRSKTLLTEMFENKSALHINKLMPAMGLNATAPTVVDL